MAENEGLINEILTSIGVAMPSGLTKEGWLRDFEARLGNCMLLWTFVKNTKVEELITDEQCAELYDKISSIETEVQKRMTLTKGETWILRFLRSINESDFVAFMKMIGPMHYTLRVVSDIEKSGEGLTDNIKVALFIYLFQNLYELLLNNVDSCFFVYLERNQTIEGQSINYFRKELIEGKKKARMKKEDIGKHATSGVIQGLLEDVYKDECDRKQVIADATLLDDTIFNQMAEKLRNSSAHFNAFYDDKRGKIVFLNGDEMSREEFISLYDKLFLFLTQWMNMYLEGTKDSAAFTAKIRMELNKMLIGAERLLHGIVRSGRAKDWNVVVWRLWGSHLVRFEEKNELEGNSPKALPSGK